MKLHFTPRILILLFVGMICFLAVGASADTGVPATGPLAANITSSGDTISADTPESPMEDTLLSEPAADNKTAAVLEITVTPLLTTSVPESVGETINSMVTTVPPATPAVIAEGPVTPAPKKNTMSAGADTQLSTGITITGFDDEDESAGSASAVTVAAAPAVETTVKPIAILAGGTKDDDFQEVAPTTDGGFIVVGTTASKDGESVGNHGGNDILVVKYLPGSSPGTYTKAWSNVYGGSKDDEGSGIAQTSDGGYILIGTTESKDGDMTGNLGWGKSLVVLKLDRTGAITWQKTIGGDDSRRDVVGAKIRQTKDNGYILIGSTTSDFVLANSGSVSGSLQELSESEMMRESSEPTGLRTNADNNHKPGTSDVLVYKLTADGCREWRQFLGGTGDDFGRDIIQTADNGYVFVGSSKSTDGDLAGQDTKNKGKSDIWVAKIGSDGDLLSSTRLAVGQKNENAEGYSLIQTADGKFIVAGSAGSKAVLRQFVPGETSRSDDIYIQGLKGNVAAYGITETARNDYIYVTGSTESKTGDFISRNASHKHADLWVAQFTVPVSGAGKQMLISGFGGSDNELGAGIRETAGGDMVVAGSSKSTNGDLADVTRGDSVHKKMNGLVLFIPAGTPASSSTVEVFGNVALLTRWPDNSDYRNVGGVSAIRRTGELDTFIGSPGLTGTDWVMVTHGAAIKSDGTLVTWTPAPAVGKDLNVRSPATTGKAYVAISQREDWALAIYVDASGATHLETIGDMTTHPKILGSMPTETGWTRVAAGTNHALALRSDGTLAAWGNNDYGQLNLPAGQYSDIASGNNFSLALDFDGTIYAAGLDTAGQVTHRPIGSGFIAVDAGDGVAAALDKAGYIHVWGRDLVGKPAPKGNGYTDISLGKETAFALHESAPELPGTGPISPSGSKLRASMPGEILIPQGSSIEHTHNGVTRAFDATGKQLFWINDKNATMITFPDGSDLPVTGLHFVPSGSNVNSTENYRVIVTDPVFAENAGFSVPILEIATDSPFDSPDGSVNGTLPGAMCFADLGCSVAVPAKQQILLSDPLAVPPAGIPVFSVHKISNESWIGTMGLLDPVTMKDSAGQDARTLSMDKYAVDPDQPLRFSIVSGNWGNASGTNMWLEARANLTSENAGLYYTIIGTSSVQLPEMNITPQIWQKTDTGDVLVYTGEPVKCSAATTCVATGNYSPSDAATYFANATVLYTLPHNGKEVAGTSMTNAIVAPGSVYVASGYETRYVFIEEGNDDTCMGGDLQEFRDNLYASVSDPHGWQKSGSSDIIYATDARVKHWVNGTSFTGGKSKDYLDKADFAYFHGHGNDGTVDFDNKDSDEDRYYLAPDRARWGFENGSRIKWITFHTCRTLNGTTWINWQQSFNGLHILLGYNTSAVCPSASTGGVYAQLMRGAYTPAGTKVQTIYNAWWNANRYTVKDASRRIGVIYVDGCLGDYLPGYGSWTGNCNPTRNSQGQYTLKYDYQTAAPKTKTTTESALQKILSIEKTLGNYTLNTTVVKVPDTLMIYKHAKPGYKEENIAQLSRELGMSGETHDTSFVYENADPNPDAPFFVVQKNARIIIYNDVYRTIRSPDKDLPENVPTDAVAVEKVTEFLEKAGLMSSAVVDGTAHHVTEQLISPSKTAVVGEKVVVFLHREMDGIPVENSFITAEVGTDRDITDLFVNWRDYAPYKETDTKSIDSAFTEFTQKTLRYYPEMDTEKIIVNDISLMYYSHPAAENEDYLQPVYVFEGYIQNGEEKVPFEPVYIPATVEQFDNVPGCAVGSCQWSE